MSSLEKRVLYVTRIPSPFMVELAHAVNSLGVFEYHVAFCSPNLENRGTHWRSFTKNEGIHLYQPSTQTVESWLISLFEKHKPRVVICELSKDLFELVYRLSRSNGSIFGVWSEQPPYDESFLKALLRRQYYKWTWHKAKLNFLLAIGNRAVEVYQRLVPRSCHVALMPYYQDLDPAFQIPDRTLELPLRFLFSGRLLPRNSIRQMALAFERLAEKRPGQFTWCVSAYGTEEKWIRQAMIRTPSLAEAVSFDREFKEWNDRLRPFANADVLIVPSIYSGWGLVVPEALASGMPVISTRGVEAACYFLEHMANGIFVEPTTDDIYRTLEYCVDHLDVVDGMRKMTRETAYKGHVTVGARRFAALLSRWL